MSDVTMTGQKNSMLDICFSQSARAFICFPIFDHGISNFCVSASNSFSSIISRIHFVSIESLGISKSFQKLSF